MSLSSLTDWQNLSLTLYGYHIRNTIDGGTQPIETASTIWEDLSRIYGLQKLKDALICYSNNRYSPELEDQAKAEFINILKSPQETPSFELSDTVKGSLTPFRLHDTYAFDLTLKANSLADFQPLKKPLFTTLAPSLGSTWLLYAETAQPLQDYVPIDQEYIEAIFPDFNSVELIESDTLQSCQFLSFNVNNHAPIFVALNHNSNIDSLTQERIFYLFWYYHKIIYAYQQSRKLDDKGRNLYAQIEDYVKDFKEIINEKNRLETFKSILLEIPKISLDYSTVLRNIKDHQTTIDINLVNLKNTIQKLQKLPNTKLKFFENFLDTSERYMKQIDTDLSFLYPGETLLQRLTDNIRGIVNIEQVEQNEKSQEIDKKLENLIAYFGIGLAVSSVSSTVMTEGGQKLINDWFHWSLCVAQSPLIQYFCQGSINILFHLLVGLIVSIPLAAGILKLWNLSR